MKEEIEDSRYVVKALPGPRKRFINHSEGAETCYAGPAETPQDPHDTGVIYCHSSPSGTTSGSFPTKGTSFFLVLLGQKMTKEYIIWLCTGLAVTASYLLYI